MTTDINRKVARIQTAADREQMQSPEMVQKNKAVRFPPAATAIHKAYCKTDAGAAAIIVCYLDEDETGEEITVGCSITGGGNLNSAIPRLEDGTLIFVTKIDGTWYCTSVFQTIENCDCYIAP